MSATAVFGKDLEIGADSRFIGALKPVAASEEFGKQVRASLIKRPSRKPGFGQNKSELTRIANIQRAPVGRVFFFAKFFTSVLRWTTAIPSISSLT